MCACVCVCVGECVCVCVCVCVWVSACMYRAIRSDCGGFNNLSYTMLLN